MDIAKTVSILNQIVEIELAGAVRYTQYSLMVFGHGRIPIQAWMREQASEGLLDASAAGEEVTTPTPRTLGVCGVPGCVDPGALFLSWSLFP